jgi:hypothetical protein
MMRIQDLGRGTPLSEHLTKAPAEQLPRRNLVDERMTTASVRGVERTESVTTRGKVVLLSRGADALQVGLRHTQRTPRNDETLPA